MELNGIQGIDPNYGTTATTPARQLDKNAFLKLLVTQMQNQDPLSPTDSTQFVSQMAQFSSLEEMQNLNDSFIGMAALQQSNALLAQLTQSSSLLGKVVHWTDPDSGVTSSGEVTAVKLEDGVALLEIGGQDVPLAFVTMVNDSSAPAGETDGGDGEGA
ncbi:MAG: flagellar hook capping FlgD N-terminal domain-containing protein [Planctomycetota bacterium]